MTESISPTGSKPDTTRGIARWAGQIIVSALLAGAILFLSAGRLDWAAGWAFLGLNILTQVLSAVVLIPRQSEMLADRSQVRAGTKGWDRFFTPGILVGTLAMFLTAGLDARFGWSSPAGAGTWLLGLGLALVCQLFVLWAMASNPFFALTVRIQDERGHTVVSRGPYRLVRHPGYLGSLLYTLVAPLALGSWWTFVPALLTGALIIIRTGLEDRTLQVELPGYADYAGRVRWRLVPGIW